jgi:hypothetical protein
MDDVGAALDEQVFEFPVHWGMREVDQAQVKVVA